MPGKRVLFIPTLLAVTAAPYFLLEDNWAGAVKQRVQSLVGGGESQEGGASALAGAWSAPAEAPAASPPAPQLAGPPVNDLREIFRFDISPSWVTSRWSRVSTTLASLDLEGFRVPLVTGGGVDDLAGSLTYYFDQQNRVQRITFHGYTGDHRKLVSVATQCFGLRPEATLGGGLYLAKWNGVPTSVLRISRAAVVRSNAPHAQLQVLLELNRPAEYYQLSRESRQLLDLDRQLRRW
jgi:hypothetical protein